MGRARCLSDVACGLTFVLLLVWRSRIPAHRERRSRSQRCIFVLDHGRRWASGTVRRLPDEDAIPPSAGWQPPGRLPDPYRKTSAEAVHTRGMPLNRRRRNTQCRSCNHRPFAPMIGVVNSRKFRLPLVTLMSATLALCGLSVSGCSFGDDNVGSISEPAGTPASTPQIPESMKTNDMTNGSGGPPQGLY
jgi:hypothetical protein